jgi:predicted nucleic acid-binding protein
VVTLWVVNASPIIFLAKVGLVDLLQQLGPPVVIPEAVALEIQSHGAADPAAQALAQSAWLSIVDPGPVAPVVAAYRLDAGESAVLTHALATPGSGVIVDDLTARNYASVLGIPYQGTIGVVIYAKQQGWIPAARPVVERLRQEGMYLSDQVMNQALIQVGE